ncbi:DUF4350 domain-containing protein [Oryzomonas sagensis]|uniref:DUF4350 domain-containing protein n=1 Tax=Oryzomonas sagensis TaxID=2603857 RepID=A0ABQ6TT64_9BACT|nr:DUF4350 domain-containing protein [Oryzomonas sagensis]KAB0672226.1 DUF4350 domain-containing protein [Oryzomonas sagensis]
MNKTPLALSLIFALILTALPSFAAAVPSTVIFDQGHGQRFTTGDPGELQLSKLADTLRASGAAITTTTAPLSDEVLTGAAGLVISGAFKPLQPEEVEAVARFVQNGGRLAVMLHIAPPLGNLLARLGIDSSNSVLHERQNVIDSDLNFRVTDLSPTPLFSGVNSFSAYGVWAIRPGTSSSAIARTSPEAWVDLNGDKVLSRGDAVGAFAVVVMGPLGKGEFTVFGDDAIFQNRFLDDNNRKLAANLGIWLTRH